MSKKPPEPPVEMSISEALNALRANGKQWRLWARAEEVATLIESQLALQSERQQALAKAEERMGELQVEFDKAETVLADAREAAARLIATAETKAEELLQAAHAEAAEAEKQAERHRTAAREAESTRFTAEKARDAALAEERETHARIEAAVTAARAKFGG